MSISSIIRLPLLLCGVMLISCKQFDEPPYDVKVPESPNMTIADLRTMVGDRIVSISEDITIGGYVTTNDKASNFYRTLCIEDATAGIEIMAGIYDLHNIYPEGCYLTIALQGCAMGTHYGILQVGTEAASYSNYPTDYFASRVLLDKHITCHDVKQIIAPMPLTLDTLLPEHCGRLVNISSLYRTALSPSNENGTWSGYNIFADSRGNTIAVYTSTYARYASATVPDGKVNITGILQYGNVDGQDMYIIKMRDETDCNTIY